MILKALNICAFKIRDYQIFRVENCISIQARLSHFLFSKRFLEVPLFISLALLISDSAGGFAGRLTRGLALAAAALFGRLSKVCFAYSLDMLHDFRRLSFFIPFKYIIFFRKKQDIFQIFREFYLGFLLYFLFGNLSRAAPNFMQNLISLPPENSLLDK